MRKLIILITVIIVTFLMILTLRQDFQTGLTLILTLGVLFILFMSYIYFEKNSMGTKEIAVIATLSAFSAVSRIVFAPLPNIQPVTFLIALAGFVYGPYEGFLIGSTSGFLSNIFLGQGPWTPWQMFSWGLVGIITGFLGKRNKPVSSLKFSILCFLFGFMFDWIMNIWHIIGFIRPVNLYTVIGTYLSGLTFDVFHGGSSFVFSILFYDTLLPVLQRYKRRMEIQITEYRAQKSRVQITEHRKAEYRLQSTERQSTERQSTDYRAQKGRVQITEHRVQRKAKSKN